MIDFFCRVDDSGESLHSDISESKSLMPENENRNENCSQKLSTQTLSATVRVIQKDDSQKKTRELYGPNEHCYVMDAKSTGNIGRYLNVRKLSRNN